MPHSSELLLFPVGRDADQDKPCGVCRLDYCLVAGFDENGLGIDARDLLNHQRGARDQTARVAAATIGVGRHSEQLQAGV